MAYDWPGNVRELQNVSDRALIVSPGPARELLEALSIGNTQALVGPGPQWASALPLFTGTSEPCPVVQRGEGTRQP